MPKTEQHVTESPSFKYTNNKISAINKLLAGKDKLTSDDKKSLFPDLMEVYSRKNSKDTESNLLLEKLKSVKITEAGVPILEKIFSDDQINHWIEKIGKQLKRIDIVNKGIGAVVNILAANMTLDLKLMKARSEVINQYKLLLKVSLECLWASITPNSRTTELNKLLERTSKILGDTNTPDLIDLTNVDIRGIDFSNMPHLSLLHFGYADVKSTKMPSSISPNQLLNVENLRYASIDDKLYQQVITLRYQVYNQEINSLLKEAEVIKRFAKSLEELSLLSLHLSKRLNVGEVHAENALSMEAANQILTSRKINKLPEEYPFACDKVIMMNRDKFFLLPKSDIEDAIHQIRTFREGKLTPILLGFVKGKKNYHTFTGIIDQMGNIASDSRKQALTDLKGGQLSSFLSQVDLLKKRLLELIELRDKYQRTFDLEYQRALLADQSYKMTKSLEHAVRNATFQKNLLDISNVDYSSQKHDFQKLTFKNVLIKFSDDQKKNLLSDQQRKEFYNEILGFIKKGDIQSLNLFIDNGCIQIDEKDHTGLTPLMQACRLGSLELVKYFVELKHASLNKPANILEYVLSCFNDPSHPIFQYLLLQGAQKTIYVAVACLDAEFLRKHLTSNNVNQRLDAQDKVALHVAAYYGKHQLVARFIDIHHANVDSLDALDRTALWYACSRNNVDCVKVLVAKGASIEVRDKNGISISDIIYKNAAVEVLQYLIAAKKIPVATDIRFAVFLKNYRTIDSLLSQSNDYLPIALNACVRCDHSDVLVYILGRPSNTLSQFSSTEQQNRKSIDFSSIGSSSFSSIDKKIIVKLAFDAARYNKQKVLLVMAQQFKGLLLEKNETGDSILGSLAFYGHTTAFIWFETRFDHDISQVTCQIPLPFLAVQQADFTLLKFLFESKQGYGKFDNNAKHEGKTLLHVLAAMPETKETEEILDYLLKLKPSANILEVDASGRTPMHVATERDNLMAVKALEQAFYSINGGSLLTIANASGSKRVRAYLLRQPAAESSKNPHALLSNKSVTPVNENSSELQSETLKL